MRVDSEPELRRLLADQAALREETERLGDRLAWARLWDRDHPGSEMLDAAECLQQALETIGYTLSERDDAIADYEQRRDGGIEMADAYSPALPYAR